MTEFSAGTIVGMIFGLINGILFGIHLSWWSIAARVRRLSARVEAKK